MTRGNEPGMSKVGGALWQIVKDRPGIHFRALEREARLSSAGQLRHHLDRLERTGLLIEVEDGHYKRFFVAGAHDARLRPELARFARPVPRLIGGLLLRRTMNRTELRRLLGCADSTLGYHLRRMVQMGDLGRSRGPNCCLYSLVDPERVRRVLVIHEAALAAPVPAGAAQVALEPRVPGTPAPTPDKVEPRPELPAPPPSPAPREWGAEFDEALAWARDNFATLPDAGGPGPIGPVADGSANAAPPDTEASRTASRSRTTSPEEGIATQA